jgi:hypothetical protein
MSEDIYIIRISINGLKVIKKVNIKDSFLKVISDLQKRDNAKYLKVKYFFETYLESCENYKFLIRQY